MGLADLGLRINRAQEVVARPTPPSDSTGLLIAAAAGGLLATSGTITVIVSMVMKRNVRRELARL